MIGDVCLALFYDLMKCGEVHSTGRRTELIQCPMDDGWMADAFVSVSGIV